MLNHEFDKHTGILYLYPQQALEKKDFEQISAEIDPYIRQKGKMNGVLIRPVKFPYWKNFEAMSTHVRFILSHMKSIKKIAIVYDGIIATLLPALMNYFVVAQIKHFKHSDQNRAASWITKGFT